MSDRSQAALKAWATRRAGGAPAAKESLGHMKSSPADPKVIAAAAAAQAAAKPKPVRAKKVSKTEIRNANRASIQAEKATRSTEVSRPSDPGFHQGHLGASVTHKEAALNQLKIGNVDKAKRHWEDMKFHAQRAEGGSNQRDQAKAIMAMELPEPPKIAKKKAPRTYVTTAPRERDPMYENPFKGKGVKVD